MNAFCRCIRLNSLCLAEEGANVKFLTAAPDANPPLTFLKGDPYGCIDALGTRRKPSVLLILGIAGKSQIRPCVICFNAVSMVNHLRRMFASHVKPDHTVNKNRIAVNFDFEVSVLVDGSNPLPSGAALLERGEQDRQSVRRN